MRHLPAPRARATSLRQAREAATASHPEPVPLLFVLTRGSLALDWAGPAEAFRLANLQLAQAALPPRFALHFAGPDTDVVSSVGLRLAGLAPLPEPLPHRAWVLLVGHTEAALSRSERAEQQAQQAEVVRWLQRVQPGQVDSTRLVTVCAGALLAARAGLLAGRRVTTHHDDLATLAHLAPQAQVLANRVFVDDGRCWSSAGVTAGIDLALHLVAHECGAVVAARVAQSLAMALRRGPDDPELSPFLAHRSHMHARLHRVQDAVARAPQRDWSAEALAAEARTTVRTLTRLFTHHTGTTPLAYVRSIRLAIARAALAAGHSVTRAADAAGFSSELQLRRAWHAQGLPGVPSGARGASAGGVAR
jgi:transcriptional regulator GlxA family with amidase domain